MINKSFLRRIFVFRFIINVCKIYNNEGAMKVIQRICEYLFSFVTDKYSSESSTVYNDIPKILTF